MFLPFLYSLLTEELKTCYFAFDAYKHVILNSNATSLTQVDGNFSQSVMLTLIIHQLSNFFQITKSVNSKVIIAETKCTTVNIKQESTDSKLLRLLSANH